MKKKIYCFNNGGTPGFLCAMAMCEDGMVLASHVCSSVAWMPHDLGITSDWKHESYNNHCGIDGWDLEWVPEVSSHAGLMAAYELNQQSTKDGNGD